MFQQYFTVPPAPQNVVVRRSSVTVIEVTWDEPKIPVAGYRIYYNQFDLEDMEIWAKLDIGPYTVAEITGLEPKTSYAVRVQARSVDGRLGNYSNVIVTDFLPRKFIMIYQNERLHGTYHVLCSFAKILSCLNDLYINKVFKSCTYTS